MLTKINIQKQLKNKVIFMKTKIENIINELEEEIQAKELKFVDVLVESPIIIKLLESGFEKLKLLISSLFKINAYFTIFAA